ncbi:MAG: aryl-sulfate sulfotransferase [Myxococcota bacterium]
MRFATFWVLIAACTGEVATDDTAPTGFPPGDCEATLTMSDGVASTGIVSWTTDEPGRSWVEYGENVTLGQRTVAGGDDLADHTFLLAGVPTSSVWYWQAVTETADGDELRCTMQTIDTGPRPRGLKDYDVVEGPTADVMPGFRVITSQIGESFTVMTDARGRGVWWYPEAEDTITQRMYVGADGVTTTRMTANNDFSVDESMIHRVRLDGEALSETRVPMGHHDFVELDDATYAYAYVQAVLHEAAFTDDSGTYGVMGDAIVEISEDGAQSRTVWSSWDTDLPLVVDPETDEGFYSPNLDWTHVNAVQYVASQDAYLISVRNLDLVLLVAREDGRTIWQFGGDGSDFELTDGRFMDGQHAVELLDDTHLLMFDNGGHDGSGFSRAVEYELDLTAMTAREAWEYDAGQSITAILLGDVERLPNGNTAIVWGNQAVYSEVSEPGEVQLRLDFELGPSSGYVDYVETLGGPL